MLNRKRNVSMRKKMTLCSGEYRKCVCNKGSNKALASKEESGKSITLAESPFSTSEKLFYSENDVTFV